MRSVLKSAANQVGGLARNVASKIASVPSDVLRGVVGGDVADFRTEQDDQLDKIEQGANDPSSNSSSDDGNYSGFATKEDHDRYAKLSGEKDGIEIASVRRAMRREFSLPTTVEEGMQKERMRRNEKREEKDYLEEQEGRERVVLEEQEQVEGQIVHDRSSSGFCFCSPKVNASNMASTLSIPATHASPTPASA